MHPEFCSIYLSAQVLKTGVVLADLPGKSFTQVRRRAFLRHGLTVHPPFAGLQDTNLARVKATQDYLMRCNNIFIVAKISRAITDQSLQTSLFKVLSHKPSSI